MEEAEDHRAVRNLLKKARQATRAEAQRVAAAATGGDRSRRRQMARQAILEALQAAGCEVQRQVRPASVPRGSAAAATRAGAVGPHRHCGMHAAPCGHPWRDAERAPLHCAHACGCRPVTSEVGPRQRGPWLRGLVYNGK